MKAVIQRVKDASVTVDGVVTGKISNGLLVYFGVGKEDEEWMVKPFLEKLVKLRIFEDENGKMNLSVDKFGSEILFVSQFTLYGDCVHGNRPGFDPAMDPETAERFYEKGKTILKEMGYKTECGVFGAHMEVRYMNDGPITFILDSRDLKLKKS